MTLTLIKNGQVLSGGNEPYAADILIEDDRIAAIGVGLDVDDAECIDASGMLVMPGFVDSHRHTWQSLLRGAATDWTLAQYYTGMRVIMGSLYSAQDMYLGNYLGALECLNNGITTLYDWSHNNNTPDHADAAVRGLKDAGIRAVWAYGNANAEWIPPNNSLLNLADMERVRRDILPSDGGMVTMAMAARGPEFTSLENTVAEMTRARELGLRISVHVGVGPWCKEPMKQMAERGLLGPDMQFVHCNTLIESDLKLLVECGGTSSLTPETELNMGMGDLPTMRMLALGHRPSLAVDVVSSAPGDMFSVMRTTLTSARADVAREILKHGGEMDPIPLTSREVFEFATLGGARSCGHAGKTGHIAVGYQADILLLDTNAPNMIPLNYGYGLVVEGAHPGNVDSVFVAGVAKKRGGKLVGVDMAALRKTMDAARDGLFLRAGLDPRLLWMPKPHLHAAQ